MNRLFNKTFLLCCIVSIPVLHAMDDEHKAVDLKELLQDVDQLLEEGAALHKALEQQDTQREQYMDTLFKRQMVLMNELTQHDSSKKFTKKEAFAYTKRWVETIENTGKIKVFLDFNMIKDAQAQYSASAGVDDLQHTVNELIEHDRLIVTPHK